MVSLAPALDEPVRSSSGFPRRLASQCEVVGGEVDSMGGARYLGLLGGLS